MIKVLPKDNKVQSKEKHQEWLKNLAKDDFVLVQSFHKINKSLLNTPYEYWQYEIVQISKIEENKITCIGHILNNQNYSHHFI